MEAVFIPASRRGATQSHGKLSFGGYLYRFQKGLAGGQFRWKCAKAEHNFKCAGFAVTDGCVAGAAVLRSGSHAAHCEPSASVAEAAAIRQEVRAKACVAGSTPSITVAQCLAKSSPTVAHSLPSLGSLKRSAQNAMYRSQKKAQSVGSGGVAPNYNSLEALSIPPQVLLREGGENFLLHDSGPGADRILMFGCERNIRSLAQADVWGADGTFKVCPRLWCQLYTVHAVTEGYCLPCVYALLPNKTQEAYTRMWGEIRVLLGDDYDKERVVTVDFERAAINALTETFPHATVAGCYFHLGQSHYRKVGEHGLSQKYLSNEEFRLRVKQLSALAFLPLGEVVAGYEHIENSFEEDEQGFLGYFESTYIGRRVAAGRRNPLFDHALWNVEDRMTLGSLRTNNAVESFHNAFAKGVVQADHPSVYRFIQSLQLQQNISSGATRTARCSASIDRPRDR